MGETQQLTAALTTLAEATRALVAHSQLMSSALILLTCITLAGFLWLVSVIKPWS